MANSQQSEKPKVINLSDKTLTNVQIDILKKGLKFTPTPRTTNYGEIKDDISEYCRRLRLAEKFLDYDEDDESLVRNKSNYRPPKGRNKTLDEYCEYISNYPIHLQKKNCKSNFSKLQWKELENLRANTELIIKEADKGSAVVIMDTEYYKQLILNMLQDNNYYEIVQRYNQNRIMNNLKVILHLYKKCLTDKELDYLTNFQAKTSNFYGLPKIHKSKMINVKCEQLSSSYVQINRPTDLKLRPIVAGPICETSHLSNFLDILLKPFLSHVRSFIRDDLDMLNHLPEMVNEETIFVSFDVVNLYTNIPHDYGVEAITYWLEKYNDLPERIDKNFVIDGLKFILENNFFTFDNEFYRQKSGTAMGTKVAPTYANLVMGYLELKIYQDSIDLFDVEFQNYIMTNWKRYLDDCFILWNRSIDDLNQFKALINGINQNLQFTMEYSKCELPFLDILVMKKDNKIETDIYYKPTDSKQYLLFNSCHPKHTRCNIPFNLARRICTIVTNIITRDKRLEELKMFLIDRQYPISLITNGIEKAKAMDISELRTNKNKIAKNIVPYISTFNPRHNEIFNIMYNNLPVLNNDERMQKVLQKNTIIKSKRQPKSLKKLISSAKLPNRQEHSVTKCGKLNCETCAYILEGATFQFKNGTIFKIKQSMNCASSQVIYVITCRGCNEQYIGQTGQTIRKRMTLHRQQIRDPSTRTIPLSGHIDQCARNMNPKFYVFPLYLFTYQSTEQQRENKESIFIHKYRPSLNA